VNLIMNKLALLLGDYTDAPYHPLNEVEQEIAAILQNQLTVHSTEDYDQLRAEHISKFDLCITYTDFWKRSGTVSSEQVAGLLSYVSSGGGLLVIHTGISLQIRYELLQLMGAKFTGHPAYQKLDYRVTCPDHPIMEGIEPFSAEDEPYQFEFDPFTEKKVLLEYELDGQKWPAAWAHAYGLGRVVYLMPGHRVTVFQESMFRKLIVNSSLWAMGDLPEDRSG
jgi:type 1 glutamine amidotransferase